MILPFVPKLNCPSCKREQPFFVIMGEERWGLHGYEHKMRCTECTKIFFVSLKIMSQFKTPIELSEELGRRTLSPDGTC